MQESTEFLTLKKTLRATWMAGDFGKVAALMPTAGPDFIARLNLRPGVDLLDIACGTGNLSLPAAAAGARVTGLDLAPNLLEQARQRASDAHLAIDFIEGDAEELPFPDASFDVVTSMFGAMFAPRPERAAAEMLRVCRPGGTIAMGNWTPTGFTGKMFAVTARHVPPPPGIPPSIQWGDCAIATQRLGPSVRVTCTERALTFDYPLSPAGVVEFFRQYFGPTQMAFARLDPEDQQGLQDDLVALFTEHNESGGDHTIITNSYMEIHAAKSDSSA